MNAHLAKPVDVEKVLMTIRRLREKSTLSGSQNIQNV